jgi:hypothetical protein
LASHNQEEAEMDATTVAIDLAKDVFEVALANRAGRIVERKRLTRTRFERFLDELPAGTEVVMEACGTARDWGAGVRPAAWPSGSCLPNMSDPTSVAIRRIGPTRKRCSRPGGVAGSSLCR